MRYLLPLLVMSTALVAVEPGPTREGVLAAADGVHATWAQVRDARWPGDPAGDEEFGPAVDGVKLAARVLPPRDPAAPALAVAVTVWNDNDQPMSFYGFGWSADLLPHGRAPQSNAQRVGGPKPTWYGTMTMQPQERLSYVVAARIDAAARHTARQVVRLEFHLVPGLKRWAPGAVISQGALLSPPVTVVWPASLDPSLAEGMRLLTQAVAGDAEAEAAFLAHPQAVAACEQAALDGSVPSSDLISFILERPALGADHVALDCMCRGGPWTWARNRPNKWAWFLAELESHHPGVATGARADLALAIADLGVRQTWKRDIEAACHDTYSALLTWNAHYEAALVAQRWALERSHPDRDDQAGMAARLAVVVANRAMGADAPGPFAQNRLVGPAARDALIALLDDDDPLVADAGARILASRFGEDPVAQEALLEREAVPAGDASSF